jgi:hypothetical protein
MKKKKQKKLSRLQIITSAAGVLFLAVLTCAAAKYMTYDYPGIAHSAPLEDTQTQETQGQAGTTLMAEKSEDLKWLKTYDWQVAKSASPETWELYNGDSASSAYTVTATKDNGTETQWVEGQICVTNGGAVATENLAISDSLTITPSKTPILTQQVDVSAQPILEAGQTFCYPYRLDLPANPSAGATYKDTASVTITNHSGHLGSMFGPSPSASAVFPSAPTPVNDTITVNDSNGSTLTFSQSGNQSYEKQFTCPSNAGQMDNTATVIYEDGSSGPSATAAVNMSCNEINVLSGLELDDPALTSFTRTHNWTIAKTAGEPVLTLAQNQTYAMPYTVTVNAPDATDSNWKAEGTFDIKNPVAMAVTVNNVTDKVSPDITANYECGVTFPYTLAPEEVLNCTWNAALPDGSARSNIVTATVQNYSYDIHGTPVMTGTTDYSASEDFNFTSAEINHIDETVSVNDSSQGNLGTVTVGVDKLPKTFSYIGNIGPYTACGDMTAGNTALYTTNETGAVGTANASVTIHVPCSGCTLTIGYWKNHAGLTKQTDMLTRWLPVLLGNVGGTKSVNINTAALAVKFLGFNGDASNGINKLYGQLLAAKLNVKNGAGSSAVASVMTAADGFLATNNQDNWKNLSKNQKPQVLEWMNALDNFNNGVTGPGHCSE